MNGIDTSDINPCIYDQLICDKGAKNIQWEKNMLLNKWCWENWTTTCKSMKLEHCVRPHTKIRSQWVKYLNARPETIRPGFRKGRGTRDQVANIHWIIEKAKKFQKNIYFCLIDSAKALAAWITTHCGKFLKTWEYQTT